MPTPPFTYADQFNIVLRVAGDFRFSELQTEDGDEISIVVPTDVPWSAQELKDVTKRSVITPDCEPYRITETYVEVEAGASGASWTLLIEYGMDLLQTVGIPSLVAYLTTELSKRRRQRRVSRAANALTLRELEYFAKQTLIARFQLDYAEDQLVSDHASISTDGIGSISVVTPPPGGRRYRVEVQIDPSGLRIVRTSMKRRHDSGRD